VVVAALSLLLLSGGKTAGLLLLPALAGAGLITRLGDRGAALAVLVLVGGLALLTLGSVAFPAIAALLAPLPDPSFTGRTDIWRLALEAIGKRPLTGYGYNVFWDSGAAYLVAGATDTAALVSHAHSGFLDTALSAGLPGLLLVVLWAGVAPLRHISAIKRRLASDAERAFLRYLVAAWLFTLLASNLEAILFNRGDAIWFTGLLAIVCLRYWARMELAR
jgi:O-antigen ligase